VLQTYVKRPCLLSGRKFDLRIYVVVTSYDPLIIYVSEDGLVRLSTRKYTLTNKSIKNRAVHLTNYSVQKKDDRYVKASGKDSTSLTPENENSDGKPFADKWNIKDLWPYLMEKYGESKVDAAREKINEVIVKTLLSCETEVLTRINGAGVRWNQCFEIHGFDILLDKKLKPWLLEVNLMPSLSSSSPLDKYIKSRLVCDVFNLIGMKPTDMSKVRQNLKKIQRQKVWGKNLKDVSQRKTISNMLAEDFKEDSVTLNGQDFEICCSIYEQLRKAESLHLVFPKNRKKYETLFTYRRYNNELVWKFLRLSEEDQTSLLERSFKNNHDCIEERS